MKNLIILGLALLTFTTTYAQGLADIKATASQVEFMKLNIETSSIEFPISTSNLTDIFEKKMSSLGAKKSSKAAKGFYRFEGVKITPISDIVMDYYYTITGDKSNAKISIFFSKGYNNFLTSKDDALVFQKAKIFLESMNVDVTKILWNERILAQEKVIKEEEKTLKNQNSDVEDLIKKKADIEAKIESAKNALEQQTAKLKTETEKLEKIKSESH